MNYLRIETASISNGPGFRVVLWVSGCSIHCKGCHNEPTWDFSCGVPFDTTAKDKLMNAMSKPWIKGITFSGGHPLEPEHVVEIERLITEIRQAMPSKDIWLYTGLTLNGLDFDAGGHYSSILSKCDVVVDGPFVSELKDITLAFRGSTNQRLIDVKKTKEAGRIVLYENETER